jgi:putative addiction module killer protein
MMRKVFQTETYRKWEKKLKDRRAQKIITARLYRIANGLFGDTSPVGEGVSELRIHYGAGCRIYFKQEGDIIIILLCGGNKSTQEQDIQKAKEIAERVEVDKL